MDKVQDHVDEIETLLDKEKSDDQLISLLDRLATALRNGKQLYTGPSSPEQTPFVYLLARRHCLPRSCAFSRDLMEPIPK